MLFVEICSSELESCCSLTIVKTT